MTTKFEIKVVEQGPKPLVDYTGGLPPFELPATALQTQLRVHGGHGCKVFVELANLAPDAVEALIEVLRATYGLEESKELRCDLCIRGHDEPAPVTHKDDRGPDWEQYLCTAHAEALAWAIGPKLAALRLSRIS